MVSPLSGGFPAVLPPDRGLDRRAAAPARSDYPAEYADARQKQRFQPPESAHRQHDNAGNQDGYTAVRPIEMRAQAARLESDSSSTLPRYLQQALSTYHAVAGSREDPEVEVLGLDLKA